MTREIPRSLAVARSESPCSCAHNQRPIDTLAQMRAIARGMVGKRLRYRELIS
ncbi:MAG: hypothetical protein OXC94_11785 [Chloroflexi bacterium]|nr:hypothetical protein [Chloroflexota bacterium]